MFYRLFKKAATTALCSALLMTLSTQVQAKADLNELAAYAKVDRSDLENALSQARLEQKIINAMNKPGEAKPWWQYRKIFITVSRINAGVDFYFKNEKILNRASKEYGVPEEIICAIIGVETYFGKHKGTFRVLDALYTLGFNYPKREAYFSKEFARFVALAKREGWNYDDIKGSYAGAMGYGQFMPSAYLDYAVDFNGDGKINLFDDTEDAIGSVASYFKGHGWAQNRGIYYPAHVHNADVKKLMDKGWDLSVDELYKAGVTTKVNLSSDQNIRLFDFDLEDGSKGYAVGLNNFHSIMRYNTSKLYARAVYELSEYIAMGVEKKKRQQGIYVPKRSRKP